LSVYKEIGQKINFHPLEPATLNNSIIHSSNACRTNSTPDIAVLLLNIC